MAACSRRWMNVKSGRQSHSQWQAITRTAESRRSLVASASFLDEGWSVTDDSQIQEKEVGSREGVEEDSLRKLEELAKRGLSADGDARGVGNAANAARRAAAQALARAAEKKAGEESSDEKNVCAEASSGFTLLPEGGFIVTGDEDAQLFSGEGWRESAAPEQGGQGEKFVGEGEDVLMSLLEGWEVEADEGGDASVEDEDDEDDVFRRPGTVMSSGMERELAASEEGERSDSEELEGVQIHPGNTQVSSRDILDTVNFRDDRERVSLQEQTLVGLSMHEIRQLEAAQQVANSAAGRRLWSPVDERTRPMMEKVRNGVFSALTSRTAGGGCNLPSGSRWLDCYAGTGALGLEALSRGCSEACFVELDNWVVSEVLSPNIRGCGFEQSAAVHCCAAEEFMQRAHDHPGFAGGAFDFLSICPPYLKVSYPEMLSLLQGSPLMHDGSHLILEYPKRLEHEICDTIGSLVQLRVRKYGRTILVHFGPEP